jgi:hypothetical protein
MKNPTYGSNNRGKMNDTQAAGFTGMKSNSKLVLLSPTVAVTAIGRTIVVIHILNQDPSVLVLHSHKSSSHPHFHLKIRKKMIYSNRIYNNNN